MPVAFPGFHCGTLHSSYAALRSAPALVSSEQDRLAKNTDLREGEICCIRWGNLQFRQRHAQLRQHVVEQDA